MFQTKKFLQMLGIAIIVTFFVSAILGFLNFSPYMAYVIIQLVVTYGTIGVLSVLWLPKTPYISAYLGAVSMSLLNILFSYYVFNVMIFADPDGINRSMSLAIVTAMVFAYGTMAVKSRRERWVTA